MPENTDGARGRSEGIRAGLLHRPEPPSDAVLRTRLLRALDAQSDRPLTILCAPAGFGKTVTASQWCGALDMPVAWLSLDASMNDPRWFLSYLVEAIRLVMPDSLELVGQMANAGALPAEEAVVTELSNGLNDLDDPLLVVLDDYHEVSSPQVHRIVSDLLRHPAPLVRFLINTRQEPPLPIATLRAGGQLNELRMADLAFDREEVRQLTTLNFAEPFTEAELAEQFERTEGWPVGLRLGIEASRLSHDTRRVGPSMLDRSAQAYVVAEVLELLPVQVRRGLLTVSMFSRFDARLCEVALRHSMSGSGLMDGNEFIAWLSSHNLFLVPLDGEQKWFRFHHLFASMLEHPRSDQFRELGVSEPEIRRAAAAVFESDGMTEEAISQLLLAGEAATVPRLAAEWGNELMELERWAELDRLLEGLPEDLVQNDPALLVLRAWLLGDVHSRHSEMTATLDVADLLLDERVEGPGAADQSLRGQIAALRGAYEKFTEADFDGAAADSEVARRCLAESPGRPLVFSFVLGVVAHAGAGRSEEAHRLAHSVVGDHRFADAPFDPMSWALPYLGWLEGDLTLLERHATHLMAIGDRLGMPDTVATAHYFLGVAAYERNLLEDADAHLSKVIDSRFLTVAANPFHSGVALAFTRLAQGRPEDAGDVAESTMQYILDTRSEYLLPVADGFMAELNLRRGRHAQALRWARLADVDAPRHRFMFFDPTPSLVEILLTSAADREAAGALLAESLDRALQRNHVPMTIRLLGISALHSEAIGDEDLALSQLSSAVALSQQGGMVRRLADLGPALVPLLQRLDVGAEVLGHVGTILNAIGPPPNAGGSEPRHSEVGSVPGELSLTPRELDILALLSTRRTNKEIARELLIAPATVKKHTVRLYGKLNVHGRREAVSKANALGYIEDGP